MEASHRVATATLCREYRFKPWRNLVAEGTRLDQLMVERFQHSASAAGAFAWVAVRDDEVCGVIVGMPLPWDTAQLGISAARVDVLLASGAVREQMMTKTALLRHCAQEVERRGIQHLSSRVDTEDISSVHALEGTGYLLMDGINTFALPTRQRMPAVERQQICVRLGNQNDAEAAQAIGRAAFTVDRFHNDPEVSPDKADGLYAEWVRNSFLGIAAQATVVAEDASGMLGFVTCQLRSDTIPAIGYPTGIIGLVATKAGARGRGIGRLMTMRALEWFEEQGCELTEVGTQVANIPAARLYENCGFRLASSSLTFRASLLPQTSGCQ